MSTTLKIGALVLAAFVAGAFVASPELRAFAANTIGSGDIIDNSIQSVDIKDAEVKSADLAGNAVTTSKINDGAVKTADIGDGEVKAADIATDAVGAAELQGVTKLLFVSCAVSLNNFPVGGVGSTTCIAPGVQSGDTVITTLNADTTATSRHCMVTTSSLAAADLVVVRYRNLCEVTITSTFNAGMIVYKT